MALIGKYLQSLGCDVTIQLDKTHNACKFPLEDQDHLRRLLREKIVIMEMRTSGSLTADMKIKNDLTIHNQT
jgi:hypothetical protein